MSNTTETLVRMTNQIGLNFAVMGDVDAAIAVADHIASFWDPRMKKQIFAHLDAGGEGLSSIAEDALKQLRNNAHPPSQTRATEFAPAHGGGHSDAG